MAPHLNNLTEMVQMRGHNMFFGRINKNYPELSPSRALVKADQVSHCVCGDKAADSELKLKRRHRG